MTDLSSYGIYALSQTIVQEPWSVRDEAAKRQAALSKKIMAAKIKLQKMEAEREMMEDFYSQACAQIRIEQDA